MAIQRRTEAIQGFADEKTRETARGFTTIREKDALGRFLSREFETQGTGSCAPPRTSVRSDLLV